ncbi:uncharacterized protein EV420DRAFT_1545614 [Desarmillaria tabescens]|uniref:Uncharacterized protein n=1 Tax=Armillaria tabescens TaxID=1929756 RepID=A0AA39KFT3_ARMTA|nr:uncharacterized protein EV420DRAFT_1545614 [Desarmillaria tabescens]KAK0457963.1 hypothetical protein EV420DRAFT_1545614 [Desarmillaria tabescens]
MSTTSPNAPICRFYQQGSCKYGSGCKNQHPNPVSETNKNQGQNPNKKRAQSRKKGGRSSIAEPVDHRHTNTAIDAVSGQANTDSSQEPRDHRAVNNSKSRVCFSWQKGSCAKGEACRFEHGPKMRYESVGENQMPEGENRTPLFSAVPLPQANKNPCYAWMKGTCTRGETCRFAHDVNALGFSRQRRLDRENHVKVAEAKAEEVRKENERLRQEEAQRKKDEERRQREETRLRQEEEQRRIDEEQRTIDAKRTHQCIVFGSIVTFSSGLAIQNIIAGFDSCRIRQGLDVSEFHVVSVHSTGYGRQDVNVVTSVAVAQTLAAALEGMEFRDERLEFEIGVFNQPGGMGALAPGDENVLTISCRAPSATYIVEYPDAATCRSKVVELNGRICSGRRVKVEMNQPPPGRYVPSFRRNTIKVSNLPPDNSPTLIYDFIQYSGEDVRLLKSHSFDVDIASFRLRSQIDYIDGVEVQSFNVASRGDTGAGIFSVRVRFESWESAKKVQDALINRRFDFIDDSMFWFKLPPQELYTIIIPPEQYLAQASLWTELRQSIKDHKACELFIRQMSRGDYSIQVSGAVRAAVGALKVRVESLAAGEQSDQWHQHLVRPPAELTKRITDVGAFMRADFRKHAIKLYGNSVAIAQAKTILKEELDRLMSLQFSVKLERRSVGYFLRTGLSAMKDVFGDDCVTLDIRLARITIRGGEEVRLHLNNHIAESLKMVVVQVAPGTHTCPVCYDEASAPFQLVCRHVYCTACIRHFLTSAAETGIFPLVCMGNDATCGAPISIPVIQKFLPQSFFEHLLETVFTSYIDKQPQVFGYCKTPDCTQIYRKSKSASLLRCPSCFSEICSSCGEDSHIGKSCEEARNSNTAAEQERLSEAWIMQQNGIKKCPTCSCLLEKIAGCNHIKCPLCGSHICWHCMGVFPEHDIYPHMGTEHGGFYTTNPTPNANNHVLVDPFRAADYGEQARLLREVEVRRQLEQERQRRMNRERQGSFCIVM